MLEKEKNKTVPLLKNAKLLYCLMAGLIVSDWIAPPYLGVHIAFDFTITRILNLLFIIYLLVNRKVGKNFINSLIEVQITPFMAFYMFVMVYTTIFRVNINTFFLNFLDIFTFYLLYFGGRFVVGVKQYFEWTIFSAWFLGIYGLLEYILGFSPMLRVLRTLPMTVVETYRSGQYRIMGPCGHSIAFGLLLFFFLAMSCLDFEKNEIYLFKRPVLFVILFLDIFLTGSRGPLGLAVLEVFLIIVFTPKAKLKKTLVVLLLFLIAFCFFVLITYNTPIGKYILIQITSVIDEVLGTNFAEKFGADVTWLEQSTGYRKYLPQIFSIEWLNPWLGQGANAHMTFEIGEQYLESLDNYYVALYVRYAYPGLIATVLLHLFSFIHMMRTGLKYKSSLCVLCGISILTYSLCLIWVDYLMTTKFMYLIMALYAAEYSTKYRAIDKEERKERRRRKA